MFGKKGAPAGNKNAAGRHGGLPKRSSPNSSNGHTAAHKTHAKLAAATLAGAGIGAFAAAPIIETTTINGEVKPSTTSIGGRKFTSN